MLIKLFHLRLHVSFGYSTESFYPCNINFIIRHTGSMITRYTGSLNQLPVIEMSWGKNPKRTKCSNQLYSNHHGHRYTGSLSQLPVVEMSWGKKSKKKPSGLTNFHLLVNFIRQTGPMVTMVTMVTRYIGSLSQLLVVEMTWGKKSKKKPSVLTNFHFLVNFIRHTGPMVSRGH